MVALAFAARLSGGDTVTAPTFYRDPAASDRFVYVAGDPTPELAPNGAPTLSLWVTDRDARLQLGVQWRLTPAEEEQLRETIAWSYPPLQAEEIDLQPAQARVQAVDLLIRGGREALEHLATATSSGFPPFTTLFAVALNAEQKNHAVSALHGRTGFLAVRYTVTVMNERGQSEQLIRSADIGHWFETLRGSDHIRVMPTASLKPAQQGVPPSQSFGVDERLKGAPLTFIHLERGSATAVLRPPAFATVSVALADAPLRCTTHYTTGRPYGTTLDHAESVSPYLLTAAEVGLAEIVVSAPEYQVSGAREVRVQVRYNAQGDGTDDERMVYLRGSKWEERWWVITRHPTLNGTVEVTAKVTEANGAVHMLPRRRQQESAIVIAP
jgi:hypothetical protein